MVLGSKGSYYCRDPYFMGFWTWSPHSSLVVHITGQFTLFIIISLVVQFQAIWKICRSQIGNLSGRIGIQILEPPATQTTPSLSHLVSIQDIPFHLITPLLCFCRVNPCSPPNRSHDSGSTRSTSGKELQLGRQKMKISIMGIYLDVP